MEYLPEQKKKSRTYVFTVCLWLATVVLGGLSFLAARTMIIRTYLRFFPGEAWAASVGKGGLSLLNIMISLPLAILVIAIVIGGFEYHYRQIGKPGSWWLFARTLAVEIAILLLALFI